MTTQTDDIRRRAGEEALYLGHKITWGETLPAGLGHEAHGTCDLCDAEVLVSTDPKVKFPMVGAALWNRCSGRIR